MSAGRARAALAAVALLLPTVIIALTRTLWQHSLPDRIASHWSDLGAADGSMPTAAVFLVAIIGSGAATVAGIVLLLLARMQPRTIRASLFWIGMVQGLALAIWVVPAGLSAHAGSAADAVLGPWFLLLTAFALYGAVPYSIYPRAALPDASTPPPLQLAPTETGAWARTITARVFVWVTVLMVAMTVVVVIPMVSLRKTDAAVITLVVMLASLVAVSMFVRLRVTIDWRGLRVVSWLFGVPLKRVPLDRIRAVNSCDLRPGEWGGWGYRVSPGRSAIILRAGPGMVVTTVDNKQFAITLDDPDTPAALLTTLSAPASRTAGS